MKQTLRTYIYTCLIFLIPFILISFILSIISYFMQMNTLFIQIGFFKELKSRMIA